MSLFVCSLNSGSNGNCYYIANQREAILVDAGISCRETEKRMARLGLSMERVKAIFVSHEHHDHIRGVPVLSKKYQIPVYITDRTLQHGSLTLDSHLVRSFKGYSNIAIGELSISAFPKFHDAAEPHSFVISGNNVKIGVFTDIGKCCDHVVANFKQCNAVFLEANYDSDLLRNGSYPYHLKQRIVGGKGHLSNAQAFEMFIAHKSKYMSHVFLSHLSKDNNCPKLVEELFNTNAGNTKVVVASRYEESSVYEICQAISESRVIKQSTKKDSIQYSLF